jgi:vancomycin permeability regulator SanA
MGLSTAVKTVVVSVAATLLLYIAYQFIDLRTGNSLTTVPRSDCIVILGASIWPGGVPSPILRDRLARAAELYQQGVADKIICTGGVGKYPPAEAEVCKEVLTKAGVAEANIILELSSHSTSDQAELVKEICDREGFKSIALVTSFFHEKRATQLFRRAGLTNIADARCMHERFNDLDFWVARDALALALINWWHWALMGLGLGAAALWYQSIRRRRRKREAPTN